MLALRADLDKAVSRFTGLSKNLRLNEVRFSELDLLLTNELDKA